MRKFLKWRYGATAVATTLFIVACSEATKNPVSPDSGFETAGFAPRNIVQEDIGQCMGDDAVDNPQNVSGFGTDPLDFNCTANDVSLANARTPSGAPIQCAIGDTVTVDIVADVTLNAASARSDIGIWVGINGNTSAETGACAFFYLPNGSSPAISNIDLDQCGDLDSAAVVTNFPLSQINLVCQDPNNDGLVEIPSCVSWTQPGGDRECSAEVTGGRRAGTLPANKSKCNCEPFFVPIQIKGQLTVVKQVVNDNGGTAGVSAFGITTSAGALVFDAGTGTTTKTYTATSIPVDSGAYTLRESDIAGYSEGTWSCTGGGNLTNNTITGGSVTIDWGQNVTCTIVNNDQQGQLTIVKQVVNDNGGTAGVSAFGINTTAGSLSFGTGVVNGSTTTYTATTLNVNAGSYTLRENDIAGYTEGTWSCTPTAASPTSITGGLIQVGNGSNITCTIINNDSQGSLQIIKQVVNDNGGTSGVSAFGINTNAGSLTFDAGVTSGSTTTYTATAIPVNAGTYTLRESDVTGYTEGTWSCTPTAASPTSITGGQVVVASGQAVVCTIVNNDQQGQLTIVKQVVNDNGGTAAVAAFGINTTAGSLSFGTGVVNGSTTTYTATTLNVNAGSYTLRENDIAGYTEGTWSCTPTAASPTSITGGLIQVANGANITCTIINNDSQGSLQIVKQVVNDNGGTLGVSAFGINTDAGSLSFGTGVVNGSTTTYTATAIPVNAGTYTLRESDVAGYSEGTWSCTPTAASPTSITGGQVAVANGQAVVCTIVNNDQQGSLTIVKNVVNDNGGTAVVAAFGINTTAGALSFGTGVVNGSTTTYTATTLNVNAGNYNIRENDITGYDEGTWSCTPTAASPTSISGGVVAVGNGVAVTCTITNNDQPAKLVVRKIVIGDGATFDFTATGSGVTSPFTLSPASDNIDSVVYSGINAGTKTVTEGLEDGYVLTDLGCSDQAPGTYDPALTRTVSTTIPNGGTVTCTFINEQVVGETTRTQGFWQTHLSLAWAVWNGGEAGGHTFDGVSDNLICGRAIDTQGELMAAFWSNIAQTSTKSKRSALDQARMRLLQQLIAAELNHEAFGSSPSGSISIEDAEAAFCGTDIDAINAAASAMAAFNEGGDDGEFTPGVSANGKKAKDAATLSFWDILPAG